MAARMTVQRFEYEIFADYFQFYLQDESAEGNLGDSWTDEAVARMLAIARCTVGVGTVRNMDVPVTVEVLDNQPSEDFAEWDHVVECTLEIPSGRIVIAGCTDYFAEAARIEVVPGIYRARVAYGGLDTLSDDGLDGNDRYRVQLWRADAIEPRIIKQRAA